MNNPFPATLAPDSCLGVVVRHKATEKVPIASELVITSDDPTTPVKTLDLMAHTIWNECGCKQRCDKCRECSCDFQRDCFREAQAETAAATQTTRTIDRRSITMGDRVRRLQPAVDPRTFAFCWATPIAPRSPAAGQPLRSGSRKVVQFDATSAGRLAGISSNQICVTFVVVPAMVVADSQVVLDSAPLQAPVEGAIMMAGAPHASFQKPGAGEPLK